MKLVIFICLVLFVFVPAFRCFVLNLHNVGIYSVLDLFNYIRYQKWKDFNEYGIKCFVGMFGHGKTLSMTHYALTLYKQFGERILFVSNYKLIGIPYVQLVNFNQLLEIGEDKPKYYEDDELKNTYIPSFYFNDNNRIRSEYVELVPCRKDTKIDNNGNVTEFFVVLDPSDPDDLSFMNEYPEQVVKRKKVLRWIPEGTVVLIDEISLFADSQLFKDKDLNNILMRFFKLFGHYSHGGKLIIDSQSIADNHFSLRRCMSTYLYIQERKKLPFISVLYVREMIYSEDKSAVNTFDEDVELSLRKVLIFNSTYGKYDCYCYSVFTDYLPYKVRYDTEIKSKKDNLKCDYIISLNDFVHKINESYANKTTIKLREDIVVDGDGVVHRIEEENNEEEKNT